MPIFDLRLSEGEIAALAETYRGGWLSMGPRIAELEEAFAEYAGAGHAVAVSSGTAALHLALTVAGVGPGDTVVVPSLTFVATANAVLHCGGGVRFAEIAGVEEPWLSAAAVEAALDDGATAIVNVAYGGQLGQTAELAELAARRGVPLIEDAAHACGSWSAGRHAGSFGAAGAFSFFSNKNLPVGEGGVLITGDERLAERARSLRSHGMSSSTWDRHRSAAGAYEVGELGFNYRMDEPRATLALSRLKRLDEENGRRVALDDRYRRELGSLPGVSLVPRPSSEERWSCHLFPLLLDDGIDRDSFRRSLARQGVQTSVHYRPVHSFELYRSDGVELPLTEEFARREVTLPLFPAMEEWQQELTVNAVRTGLDEAADG